MMGAENGVKWKKIQTSSEFCLYCFTAIDEIKSSVSIFLTIINIYPASPLQIDTFCFSASILLVIVSEHKRDRLCPISDYLIVLFQTKLVS